MTSLWNILSAGGISEENVRDFEWARGSFMLN